jgi:tetratricopeptide (TPR) repeat protein
VEFREILFRQETVMTSSIKRFWRFSALVFILAAFGGCAAAPTPQPEKLYDPKLSPNIRTIDEAKKDLAALLKTTDIFTVYNDVGRCKSISKDSFFRHYPNVREYGHWENGKCFFYANSVDVSSDRIDFPPAPLFYEDLRGFKLTLRDGYTIDLPNQMNVSFRDKNSDTSAHRFADDLYLIQQNVDSEHEQKLAAFKEKAVQYRSMNVKPAISEEQRKYIVQANALTQQKNYAGAMDRYKKAVEIDPTSYPAAYFNMALLCAQERRFKFAIDYMNQYLLLEPDARDARSARDKIYEWEVMIQK